MELSEVIYAMLVSMGRGKFTEAEVFRPPDDESVTWVKPAGSETWFAVSVAELTSEEAAQARDMSIAGATYLL